MLIINKFKTESGYKITLNNGEQLFSIFFAGNLDLYWTIDDKKQIPIPNDVPSKHFVITKENYFIYSLFIKLYDDLKNCNVFELKAYEFAWCDTLEDEINLIKKNEEINASFKRHQEYKNLFHDQIIEWRSDDFPYEEASSVIIKKNKDSFLLTFNKSAQDDYYYQTYGIRFRNCGSRYAPFNGIFMRMYNELIDYEPNFHQTHIEEYLWQKRLTK